MIKIFVGEREIVNPEVRVERPDLDTLGYKKGTKARKAVTTLAKKQIYVYVKIDNKEIMVPCRDVSDIDGMRIPESMMA